MLKMYDKIFGKKNSAIAVKRYAKKNAKVF